MNWIGAEYPCLLDQHWGLASRQAASLVLNHSSIAWGCLIYDRQRRYCIPTQIPRQVQSVGEDLIPIRKKFEVSQRAKERQPRSNQELLIVVYLLDTVIVLQLQIIVNISFYHVVRAAILPQRLPRRPQYTFQRLFLSRDALSISRLENHLNRILRY